MGFQGNSSNTDDEMYIRTCLCWFPPLGELIAAYQEAGGKLYVCGPCVGARHVEQYQMIEGATIVGTAAFVPESLNSTQSLIYWKLKNLILAVYTNIMLPD